MTSMRQVWRALPRPNPIKCAYCMILKCLFPIFPALVWPLGRPHDARGADDAGSWGGCWALKMRYKPQQNAHNARCGQCLWFNAVVDAFSWVFDPSWSESSQNRVPIVLMMLLYEARARALYRNIISTIGTPFWVVFS